ncbi:uncharacterized protein [Malus domestica]|uniref:uncharacterized protein n=1 Tax=Malus domestica TaxID=3750 RepID=UPI00397717A5
MTRSSKSVQANILEFDDDFERTLRRTRRQQASNPPSPEPHCEENEFEEEEEPTARVVEENQEMAADNRTIKELSASGLDNAAPLCIQYPAAAQGKTEEFELKSSLLHHVPKYHGLSMEDPNKHLKEFEVVCSSMTPVNVDGNILKMKAFPFSLMDKAKDWLYELAPGTVTSWESMKRAFLEKFFPTSRVILLRKRISGIQQSQGESFPTYYERFKTLVASCPQHQMKEELLLQYFYEGLLPMERQMLDASAGGALVDMTPVAAKTLIANRAHNAQQYEGVGQRDTPRSHHVNEVSSISELQSQMANLTSMLSQFVEGPKTQGTTICGGLQTQAKEVNELKKQMGQMAEFLGQIRENGKLPSTTVVNPKGGFESAKAITLRSGKEVGSKAHESAQNKEEEPSHPTARVVPPMPQPPKPSHPSTSEKIGTDHSAPNTKVASRAMQDEGIGVEHKDPTATALKIPNVAENTMRKKVHVAATSSQHQGKAPSPNPIPIKVDSWFPSLVQGMQTRDKKVDQLEKQVGQIAEFMGQLKQSKKEETEKDILETFRKDYLDMLEDDPLETTIAQGLGIKPNLAVPKEEHAELVAALESLPQHHGLHRKLQLNELEEVRNEAYENSCSLSGRKCYFSILAFGYFQFKFKV